MKILRLLNNSYLSILLIIFLLSYKALAEDQPVDIWNIDQNKIKENISNNNQNDIKISDEQNNQPSIYDLQSQK